MKITFDNLFFSIDESLNQPISAYFEKVTQAFNKEIFDFELDPKEKSIKFKDLLKSRRVEPIFYKNNQPENKNECYFTVLKGLFSNKKIKYLVIFNQVKGSAMKIKVFLDKNSKYGENKEILESIRKNLPEIMDQLKI